MSWRTFLCFLIQFCSCFEVPRAFKLFTARVKATNSLLLGISKARNLMWFVFQKRFIFGKTRKWILGFERSKSREINLENQYYKLASR